MRRVTLVDAADLDEWRDAARALLGEGVAPDQVLWDSGAQQDLLGATAVAATAPVTRKSVASVPRAFLPGW